MEPQNEPNVVSESDLNFNTQSDEKSLGSKLKDNLIELIEFAAIVGAVLVIVRFFIAEPHKVQGSSMVPNFHTGDYIITNKLALHVGKFQRGEVVILKNPRDKSQVFIKRVIGLPGESVRIVNGRVYINKQPLNEPYIPSDLQTPGGNFLREGAETIVPDNNFFVMGDNRSGSSDSREWGPISRELMIGQAWLRYWPPQDFTFIKINQPSLGDQLLR